MTKKPAKSSKRTKRPAAKDLPATNDKGIKGGALNVSARLLPMPPPISPVAGPTPPPISPVAIPNPPPIAPTFQPVPPPI